MFGKNKKVLEMDMGATLKILKLQAAITEGLELYLAACQAAKAAGAKTKEDADELIPHLKPTRELLNSMMDKLNELDPTSPKERIH